MKKNKVDWDKIKNEYVTTRISYRDIAKKYDVSFNTLQGHAKKEHWYKDRQKFRNNITTKARQKQDKIAEQRVDDFEDLEKKILDFEKNIIINSTDSLKHYNNMTNEEKLVFCKAQQRLQKTVESALNVIHKIKYPPDKDNKDNNVTFVVPESFKKVFN